MVYGPTFIIAGPDLGGGPSATTQEVFFSSL